MRKYLLVLAFFILSFQTYAQNLSDSGGFSLFNTGAYSILERSDFRRYDNGKYIGLVRNEVRASIIPRETSLDKPRDNNSDSAFYHGNFFVLQSTLRDMRQSAQAVDAIITSDFEVMRNGSMEIENDRGYPMMRGFPAFPNQVAVILGEKWRASGRRAVDPFNKEQAFVIPFTAEFEYRGTDNYYGAPVHRLHARYSLNYRNTTAPHPYVHVMGNHEVDILIRVLDGLVLFMRDDLNDTYTLSDGSRIELKGFTLTFNSSLTPLDKDTIITDLEEILIVENIPEKPVLEEKPIIENIPEKPVIPVIPVKPDIPENPDITMERVPEGIKLVIKNIQFISDSAQILPSEVQRLDQIANALKQIPDRTFLIEGHTASTGQPANEMQLSIERAVSIINELVKRGINANRFIYKGWGGTRPIGDNSTDEGRRLNRRVEITILE